MFPIRPISEPEPARAGAVGSVLTVTSPPGRGARLHAQVPLH
jgi:hypothetical protein